MSALPVALPVDTALGGSNDYPFNNWDRSTNARRKPTYLVCFAVWPLSADAKGNNGSHVSTHEITITKKVDKSSPMMSNKKAGSNSGPSESIHFNYGGTKPVYKQQ